MASSPNRLNLGAALTVALALATASAGCREEPSASPAAEVQQALAAIRGIAQDGFTLGDADAPWTLTIIAAPTSFELERLLTDLPVLTREFVRSGRVRLQMRTPTDGRYGDDPQSRAVAKTLLAAGLQRRYWHALVHFVPTYSGSLESGDISALLRRCGVPDVQRALRDRTGTRIQAALSRADAEAEQLGADGRPVYLLESSTGARADLTSPARAGRLVERIREEMR